MKGKPPLQCRLGLGWKNRYYEVGRRQPGFWIPSKRACKRRIKLAPITVSVGSPIELSFSNIAEASLGETVALADRQSKAGLGRHEHSFAQVLTGMGNDRQEAV